MEYGIKKVKDIKVCETNARTHSKRQVEKLIKSIKEFNFINPIIIDKDNEIIAGHGRLEAAKILGMETVPTLLVEHLSEAQIRAYRIADNRLALDSEWDEDILRAELEAIKDLDFDLDFIGFEEDELSVLMNEGAVGLVDEDDVPDTSAEAVAKIGDVWLLGDHRLMCGDSTSAEEVAVLMNGQKADMVFTDPPYGIDEKTDRQYAARSRIAKGGKFNKIIGDKDTDCAYQVWCLVQDLLPRLQVWWGANHYSNFLPPSPSWFVWDKREDDKEKDFNSCCELAWCFGYNKSVRIFRHKWKGIIKASEHGKKRVHPTQKPIALAEWAFTEFKAKDNILDLFGGSGSTLIACEKTNRKCFMMELDPHYIDVIIKRWEDYTGKKATKV